MTQQAYFQDAVDLLRRLISVPSISREEHQAADVMEETLLAYGLHPHRMENNVWVSTPPVEGRPTLLLNAHIDTVRPTASWTRPPFSPTIEGGTLYGLGANDCGGGLVCLLQVFRHLSTRQQAYNLVYLASAEEEVSGRNGMELALRHLPPIDVAIVGEPTGMQPAIAEKGLMVIDAVAHGVGGHAARNEGVNAINKALDDLVFLRSLHYGKESELLGATKLSVTQIKAGTQHNVVPDRCEFVIDVRTNEHCRNEEVFSYLQDHLHSELKARSFRLHSSRIDPAHPLVRRCIELGMTPFGSPTLSDQALMPFPSLKLGPGQSSRSHTADEFILLEEMEQAIGTYLQLLDGITF